MELSIENNDPYLNKKFVEISEFSDKKLSVWSAGSCDICIKYLEYDDSALYLVIRDLKGFIEENNGKLYLTLVFDGNCNECYKNVWRAIMKLVGTSESAKDYYVVRFDSEDNARGMVKIKSVALIIRKVLVVDGAYYPQIYLNYCEYEPIINA